MCAITNPSLGVVNRYAYMDSYRVISGVSYIRLTCPIGQVNRM